MDCRDCFLHSRLAAKKRVYVCMRPVSVARQVLRRYNCRNQTDRQTLDSQTTGSGGRGSELAIQVRSYQSSVGRWKTMKKKKKQLFPNTKGPIGVIADNMSRLCFLFFFLHEHLPLVPLPTYPQPASRPFLSRSRSQTTLVSLSALPTTNPHN